MIEPGDGGKGGSFADIHRRPGGQPLERRGQRLRRDLGEQQRTDDRALILDQALNDQPAFSDKKAAAFDQLAVRYDPVVRKARVFGIRDRNEPHMRRVCYRVGKLTRRMRYY